MPKFSYIAIDNKGQKVSGSEEASSQDELVAHLQAKNLIVVKVIPEAKKEVVAGFEPGVLKRQIKFRRSRITGDDLVVFCRQLATLLGAGVTILRSLNVISQQVTSRKFYNVVKDLERSMEAGLSLHEAMAKHSKVFSELWVNLIDSGESSGNLAVVLDRLAGYLERNASFKKKIISSLIYPAILMAASIGALLFLTIRIIPTFAELFEGFNVSLPFLTQIIVLVSKFIRGYWFLTIAIIIVGFFIFRNYIKTREGRKIYENFKFRLPVFGDFFRALMVERFSSEMSTLVESGIPILYSLEITERSIANLVVAEIIRQIKEDVRKGMPLSQPLERSGFFEPLVVQMVAVGEEIGELPSMFKRINAFYQEYTDSFLVRFNSMFEPMVLLFMGLAIGLIVIGMFLPIFKIATIGGG